MIEKKSFLFKVFVFGVCVLLACGCWYGLCRKSVSDNGNGADAAREYNREAADHNRSASERSATIEAQRERAERELAESVRRVAENESRVAVIEAGLGELRQGARECQQVFARVRERDEAKGAGD